MKEFDYSQVKQYKFYFFIKRIFAPIFRLIYKMEFKGLENVPNDIGGYILAINHSSALDPILVAMSKPVPPLHFMGKAELFEKGFSAWFLTHMCCFPVNRGKGDTNAIDYAVKLIDEGNVLGICPEGRRVKDKGGVPQRAKAGVAVIAHQTGAPVLPVALYYSDKKKGLRKCITVSYGEIISLKDMGLNKEEIKPHDIKNGANMVMDRIGSLWQAEKNLD